MNGIGVGVIVAAIAVVVAITVAAFGYALHERSVIRQCTKQGSLVIDDKVYTCALKS